MVKIGLECKLYRGTAGATAATEVKKVGDVTITLDKGEADVTTRDSNGWKQLRGTLKELSAEFNIKHDPTDATYLAFQDSYLNGTQLSLFFSDGDGNGPEADCEVFSFGEDQPLDGAVVNKVTVKPTDAGRAPIWRGAGGSSSSSSSSAS